MPDSISVPCRRCLLAVVFMSCLCAGAFTIQPAFSQDRLKAERNGLCKSLFSEACATSAKAAPQARTVHGRRVEDAMLRRQQRTQARVVRRYEERLTTDAAPKRGGNPTVAVNEQDSLALVALYDALDGPAWFDATGWLTGSVASWSGISLSEAGRVIQINLNSNNLFGEIPADVSALSELTVLNLGNNFVIGTLPDEIGLLQNLRVLNLSFNFIDGFIPDSYQNLSNLVELILWGNSLQGEIPVWLTTIAGLEVFSLDFNQFTGPIPPELGLLTELEELYIDNNQLSGEIPPELGNLSNLLSTFLGNNNLQGTFPTELTQIEGLRVLSLENAGLSGELPPDIAALQQLVTLDLSSNFFEGTFPASLLDLFFLGSLYLNDNLLSGALPTELGFQMFNLVELDLAGNFFEGELPASMGQLQVLNYMDLSFNQFSGPIPDMGGNQRLRFLYMNNNGLQGEIATQFIQLFSLFELDLAWNNLEGELPAFLSNNVFMQDLRLAQNGFTGPIPDTYTSMTDLIIFDLWENDLTGPLPAGMEELDILFIFDVGGNALTGEIPTALGELSSIAGLFMDNNAFSGVLPASFATNDSLSVLLLNDNELSFIPNLTEHPLLDSLAISNNYLTFDSIEPNAKAAGGNVSYAPQRPLPVVVDELEMDIRFTADVGGTANAYQWFIGDGVLDGATQPIFEAPFAALVSDEPIVLEVSNRIVTDIILETEPVRADARLSDVVITPAEITLFSGDSLQLAFTGFDQFSNERRFNGVWSATGGTISETGLYIAAETPGTFSVAVAGLNGVTVGSSPVNIVDPNSVNTEGVATQPDQYRLYHNYPNPFTGATELKVEVAAPSHVAVAVFDVLGRKIVQVVDGTLSTGVHRFTVDAEAWPAGMYLYRIEAKDFVETRTMVKVH